METRKESDLQMCCDSQSNKRLSNYRGSLRRDNYKVLFDDKLHELMLSYSLNPVQIEEVRAYLNQLRDEEGVPFGRSIKSYSGMLDLLQIFHEREAKPFTWNKNYKSAVETVKSNYSKQRLKCLEYRDSNDILDAVSDLHTSAGWTGILTGYSHKCDYPQQQLYSDFVEIRDRAILDKSFNRYVLLYTRTQCSGEYDDEGNETGTCKHKTRPVWCVDLWVVIAELMWAKPLNEFLKYYKHSAIGKSDNEISRAMFYNRCQHSRWFSIDYSKYDAHIPSWLIQSAFDVLRSCFDMSPSQETLLSVIENDFIHKNAITADGVFHADHGNPSGSGLTAIINGICNEIITETWRKAFEIGRIDYMIMGDDNIVFLDSKKPFSEVASYIEYNFGIPANADKESEGSSSKDPKFLLRRWRSDGPYRHPHQLISRMLFPERRRNYNKEEYLTPELVFYSYILGYRSTMYQIFDVERFLKENPHLAPKIIHLSREAIKSLPYNVQISMVS